MTAAFTRSLHTKQQRCEILNRASAGTERRKLRDRDAYIGGRSSSVGRGIGMRHARIESTGSHVPAARCCGRGHLQRRRRRSQRKFY